MNMTFYIIFIHSVQSWLVPKKKKTLVWYRFGLFQVVASKKVVWSKKVSFWFEEKLEMVIIGNEFFPNKFAHTTKKEEKKWP